MRIGVFFVRFEIGRPCIITGGGWSGKFLIDFGEVGAVRGEDFLGG